jgi:hypothetical protein
VSTLVGYYPAFYNPPCKRQIAYQIDYFVPDTLIGPPEAVFDGAVGINYQDVARTKMFAHTPRLELLGFGFGQKSPRTGKLLFEIFSA